MEILNLVQGSPEWKEARRTAFNASDAPTIMGEGYISLDKHIEITLGIKDDKPNKYMEKLFEESHEKEAECRVIMEEVLGFGLPPIVARRKVNGVMLQASFDGLNTKNGYIWEHKYTSKDFDEIPPLYYWQLEQQMMVAGLDKATLTVTDRDTGERTRHDYESVPERREALIAGWKDYQVKLDSYARDDKEWKVAAKNYLDMKARADFYAGELKDAAKVLRELSGNTSTRGCGVKVAVNTVFEKKQTPAAYIKEHKLELPIVKLDKPETSYRITLEKKDDQ